jgi:hypothetical protein
LDFLRNRQINLLTFSNSFIENNRLNLSGQAGFFENGTTKIPQTLGKAYILYAWT